MLPQTEDRQQVGEHTPSLNHVVAQKRSGKAWLALALAVIAVAAILVSGIWSRVKAGATLRAETAQAAIPAVSVVSPKQTAPADEIIRADQQGSAGLESSGPQPCPFGILCIARGSDPVDGDRDAQDGGRREYSTH